MAAFTPSVSISQSADGATITVTDTSNYSTNTDGVTLNNIISRTDVVNDGLGNLINTIVFPAGQLVTTFPITKDYYLNNNLSFVVPGPVTKIGVDNYLAANFYNNAAREVSRKLRCCNCKNLCNSAVKANLAFIEATTSTLFNVPSEAQNAIDDANRLITAEECSC